jgi:cytochrome c oxidase assembly protein subunit 15
MSAPGAHAGTSGRYATAFAVLVGATQVLIVLGALVRAHEAGLACPDWPLCFGDFVPAMNLEVAFEWSHRVLAGSISIAFATLAALLLRSGGAPRSTRRWLGIALVLLIVQILLGALTVWHLLAAWTVTSHLVTGNAFALALLFATQGLREASRGAAAAPVSPRVRLLVAAAALLLLFQVVIGGLVSSRFAGMSCPEWPACNGGAWFPTWRGDVGLHLLHRWNGTLLAVALVALAWIARREPALRRLAGGAAALACAQVVVGIANVLLAIPVEVTGAHSALAAALVLTVGAATRAAWRSPDAATS